MYYLWGTTLLWAFSFSLIGIYLSGHVDCFFAAWTRILLATIVFLPFLFRTKVKPKLALKLCSIGAVQLGLMYVFYYKSFTLLSVPEVLVFTIFTPIYITLINDILKRRFSPHYFFTAVMAVLGAAIIRYHNLNGDFLLGFFMVQGANLCFAIGQISYRKLLKEKPQQLPQHTIFGYFYLGALLISTLALLAFGSPKYPTTSVQWGILLWLGIVASGLGYYFWNKGATQVNAGALAIMNNAVIPLGLIVNLTLWNQTTNILTLSIGGSIIAFALFCNEVVFKKLQIS
jgi:carboxylate/amino acid/amine transporter